MVQVISKDLTDIPNFQVKTSSPDWVLKYQTDILISSFKAERMSLLRE